VGDAADEHHYAYSEVNFVVLWADGSTTKEMYEELMFFKEAYEIG